MTHFSKHGKTFPIYFIPSEKFLHAKFKPPNSNNLSSAFQATQKHILQNVSHIFKYISKRVKSHLSAHHKYFSHILIHLSRLSATKYNFLAELLVAVRKAEKATVETLRHNKFPFSILSIATSWNMFTLHNLSIS
jgi:hypothetical protein